MKAWQKIAYFPDYSVSDCGEVRNDLTGRIMTLLVNQSGVVHVGLTQNHALHKRSVSLLVANAFLDPWPELPIPTPINLDGDRANNHVENLVWRPRWFAVKYVQQFRFPARKTTSIKEVRTQEVFPTIWDAVTRYGILYDDIVRSMLCGCRVWPTGQRFDPTSKTDIGSHQELRV